jgi:hypothetical protein
MAEMREEEPAQERAVWRAEGVAVCAAFGALAVAFVAYLTVSSWLPQRTEWASRAGSAAIGFWLATRAYRRVLRSWGFEPSRLGVPLREDMKG